MVLHPIPWFLKRSHAMRASYANCMKSCFFLAFLCFYAPSIAHEPTEKKWEPGELNTQFSRVFVFVDKAGLVGHQHAVEGRIKQGQLFVNTQLQNSKKSSIVFDMKSFDADTPLARKYLSIQSEIDEETRKKVNDNMLGLEILAVQQYPEAKLENVKWTPTGKMSKRNLPEHLLEGDFTLHKATRPIQALCDVEQKDGWLHIRGAFRILQSEYGIKPFSKMMGAVGVKDELRIYGDLWVVPQP
jgi:hypothetical protein